MAFTKIDEDIILHGGVTPLPDSPQLQPAALKAKFDEKGDAACNGFNNFVDEISDPTKGALNIGATVPPDINSMANVQAIINTITAMTVAGERDRHTHENKSTLDEITAGYKAGVDTVVEALSGIQSVATATMDPTSATEIPASSAVAAYFTEQRNTILGIVYPIGAVVLTNSINPHDLFGIGTWASETTLGRLTVWIRTA